MESMEINKVPFWYAKYLGKTETKDAQGYYSGWKQNYTAPKKYWANISAERGEIAIRQFGDDLSYDKVMSLDLSAPDIDEFTVLWIEKIPAVSVTKELALDAQGNPITPHDYIVKKVAKSQNFVQIAISRVNVK